MDGGGEVVKFDNVDGDGAHGYGFGGTLSWPATWTTPFNAVPATPNDPANPSLFYKSQTSGFLAEIQNSVFFRNNAANAYTEATTQGVFAPGNNNVIVASTADSAAPIKKITRGPAVVKGGKTELPVIFLDPRPANDALTSPRVAPADGFFTPAPYVGAFAPDQTWIQAGRPSSRSASRRSLRGTTSAARSRVSPAILNWSARAPCRQRLRPRSA